MRRWVAVFLAIAVSTAAPALAAEAQKQAPAIGAPGGDYIFDPGTQNAVNVAVGTYRQLVFNGMGTAETPEAREAMSSQLIVFRGKLLEKPIDPRAKQYMIQQWNKVDEEFGLMQQQEVRGAEQEMQELGL